MVAPPDEAVISAVPLLPFATNLTVTRPLASVMRFARFDASERRGERHVRATMRRRPGGFEHLRDDVRRPFAASTLTGAVSVMVEPDGASSGTFSHATVDERHGHQGVRRTTCAAACYHLNLNQFIAMQLRGQHGYAMAALLVGMSVAAVLMTAAMPVWKQMTRRDREAELVFRGEQYARAIGLFQKRSGPGVLPPNIDVLVSGRFLRKKYQRPDHERRLQPLVAHPGGRRRIAGGRRRQSCAGTGALVVAEEPCSRPAPAQ